MTPAQQKMPKTLHSHLAPPEVTPVVEPVSGVVDAAEAGADAGAVEAAAGEAIRATEAAMAVRVVNTVRFMTPVFRRTPSEARGNVQHLLNSL